MKRQIIAAEGNAHNPVQPPYALEADGEAYRCWGVLCSTPGFFYQGTWVDFTSEDAEACVKHHSTLKQETGYEPPIIVQHDPKHRDGANLGYAESLHLQEGEDGNTYLLAVLRWSDPGVEEKIDREEIRYLSPHIGPYQDDANRQADFVVLEVSVCSSPYQKRLGRTHLLSEDGGKEMEEVLAKIAELEAKQAQHEADLTATVHALEALEARLPGADTESEGEPEEAVEAEEEGTEGDPEPEDEDAAEPLTNAHMAEVLGGVASGLGLSEEQTQLVADAARGDVQLAARLLTTFATQPATSSKATARTSGLKGRVSVPSSTSPAAKVDKQSVYNACLSEAQGDAKKAADLYFARTKNQ